MSQGACQIHTDEVPLVLRKLFDYVDEHQEKYIERLSESIQIKSVSSSKEHRADCIRMIHWMADELRGIGVTVEICDIGTEVFPDGSMVELPPVLLGSIGNDPEKKTALVYGHLDVQPASKEDGWDTEPFRLVRRAEKLFGRGASDDKGPVLGWLHAIEAYNSLFIDLPVNFKCIFEGMEEMGSNGLEAFMLSRKDDFLSKVDYVCISDNYWLGTTKPCITYGLRGIAYFFIEVECADKDLHSGIYGGTVQEAMRDLVHLLNTLTNVSGDILIPGIHDDVEPITSQEEKLYSNIDFSVDEYKRMLGCNKLLYSNKTKILMSRWRFPSLSIHGIEGAFAEPGAKTVIPRKVTGKFSIRLVPNQEPAKVSKLVLEHLDNQWKLHGSPNKYKSYCGHNGLPWLASVDNFNMKAAERAIKHVYKVDPDMIREGGSIPITLILQDITKKDVVLLPMGACDDGAHSQNEKIDVRNYIEGTKVFCAYLHELGKPNETNSNHKESIKL